MIAITHAAPARDAARIRQLNDALRRTLQGGTLVMTAGVIALGPEQQRQILNAVQQYDRFDADDDPHGEHDFGLLTVDGRRLFWKIDYFDLTFGRHSPDPADPRVTRRVLTVMLAEEY